VTKSRSVGLRFVIARSIEHRETPAALERFAAHLSRQIGEAVTTEVVPSYRALKQTLAAAQAQLAWVPPLVLADTSDGHCMEPLVVSVRAGSSEYCSVLFARADSKLRSVHDLCGGVVAWVDPGSASGYLLPRLHLMAEGFRLEKLFRREKFAGSHGAVVRAVFDGEADVGATFGGPPNVADPDERSGWADVEPRCQVRVLFRSLPVPADAVVCAADLSPSVRVRATAALIHLGTCAIGRRVIRRLFGADGFVTFDPRALARLRALIDGVRSRGWLPPG
jgi:phosphonate transport system substrate-binding protein